MWRDKSEKLLHSTRPAHWCGRLFLEQQQLFNLRKLLQQKFNCLPG